MRREKSTTTKENESLILFADGASNHPSPSPQIEAFLGLGLLGRNNDIGKSSTRERPPNGRPSSKRLFDSINLTLADL
jgi:hypothetical protein